MDNVIKLEDHPKKIVKDVKKMKEAFLEGEMWDESEGRFVPTKEFFLDRGIEIS